MHPIEAHQQLTRRHFLTTAAGGLGGTALASMLAQDGALGADFTNPMAPGLAHFAPTAKNCIFIFMAGAPSQLDLFDPKPKLNELDGKKMHDSLLEGTAFRLHQEGHRGADGIEATVRPARRMRHVVLRPAAAPRLLRRRPLHGAQPAHRPVQPPPRPADDAVRRIQVRPARRWVVAHLRARQREPEPARLRRAHRRARFQRRRDPLAERFPAVGLRRRALPQSGRSGPESRQPRRPPDTAAASRARHPPTTSTRCAIAQMHDPEIASRIASYELAFRMQSAAPELDRPLRRKRRHPRSLRRRAAAIPKAAGAAAAAPTPTPLSPATACSPAAWSNAACASSTSSTPPGTTTRTSTRNSPTTPAWSTSRSPRSSRTSNSAGSSTRRWSSGAAEFGRTPLGENRAGRKREHRPRPPPLRLHHVHGRRRREGRPHLRRDRRDRLGRRSKTRSTSTTSTPPCSHLFGLDHQRLTYRHDGADHRLTSITRKSKVITDWLA